MGVIISRRYEFNLFVMIGYFWNLWWDLHRNGEKLRCGAGALMCATAINCGTPLGGVTDYQVVN